MDTGGVCRVCWTRARAHWQSFYLSPSPLPVPLVRVLPLSFRVPPGRDPRRRRPPRSGTFRNFIGRTGVLSEAVRAHPTLGFGT